LVGILGLASFVFGRLLRFYGTIQLWDAKFHTVKLLSSSTVDKNHTDNCNDNGYAGNQDSKNATTAPKRPLQPSYHSSSSIILNGVEAPQKIPSQQSHLQYQEVLDNYRSKSTGSDSGVGGVVLFYHVAKTGGSTIRTYFQTLQKQSPNKYKHVRYKNPMQKKYNPKNDTTCVPEGQL
jgi:hypothetical protein